MRLIWYCSRRTMNYLEKGQRKREKKRIKLKKNNKTVLRPDVLVDWVHVYNSTLILILIYKTRMNLFIWLCIYKCANDGIDDDTFELISIIFTFISVGQCVSLTALFLFISRLPQKEQCLFVCVSKKQAKTKQTQTINSYL